MFILDRDLLVFEPNLFRDVSWLGQQLFSGQVKHTSGELLASAGDFSASGLAPGHVMLAGELPLEIILVNGPGSAIVSLPRTDAAAPIITPSDFDPRPALVTTFAAQIALVHQHLLAMLDLQPWRADIDPSLPTEAAILNPADLARAEALGTLHEIFRAVAAAPGSPAAERAEMYQQRFLRERARAQAHLDLDGDGRPDAVRSLSTARLRRE
jgi:hypothetical protein